MWTVSSSSLTEFLSCTSSELSASTRALPTSVYTPELVSSSALSSLATVSDELATDATHSTRDTIQTSLDDHSHSTATSSPSTDMLSSIIKDNEECNHTADMDITDPTYDEILSMFDPSSSEIGWDTSLFVGFDSGEIDDYLCAICQNVFRIPTHSGCPNGHIFCKRCINTWFESSMKSCGVRAGYNNNGQWYMIPVRKQCPTCREVCDPSRMQPSSFYQSLVNNLNVRCPRPLITVEDDINKINTKILMSDEILMKDDEECNDCSTTTQFCHWHGKLSDLESHIKSDECPSTKPFEIPHTVDAAAAAAAGQSDSDETVESKKDVELSKVEIIHSDCQRCFDLERQLYQLKEEFQLYKQQTNLLIAQLKEDAKT